ncbi:PA3715 family protein [Dyella agri]|uniref:Uncharacterized protein n=1 Tax=Dyella agri TaxID=1926869 RepID=A0ABW8KBQ4_9GAMM
MPDWVREQMDAETPALPPYSPDDLLRAIAAAPQMQGYRIDSAQKVTEDCAPAVWGDEFTVYYRSKAIQHIYVANPREPTKQPVHEGPSDLALRLANRAGIAAAPKYAIAKPWTNDPARTLVALALPEADAGSTADADGQSFALELLVMDTRTARVLERYHENNAFNADAFSFSGIDLDTTHDDPVEPGHRAIGLLANYSHTGATDADVQTLRLFLADDHLSPLAGPIVMSVQSSNRGAACTDLGTQTERSMRIGTTRTHDHADLIVDEAVSNLEPAAGSGCPGKPSPPKRKSWTLHFDGHTYPVPNGLRW